MKVLHVLPDSWIDPKLRFLGTTKDFAGRKEYFRERRIEVEELVVPGRSDASLLPLLADRDWAGFDIVLFELALYPRSMRYLRGRYPRLKLFVRSINAEFYHQIHFVLSAIRDRNFRYAYGSAKSALVRLKQDWLSARRCDRLLSISEWESVNYWRFLAGRDKTVTVPYFVPGEYLEAESKAAPGTRENLCVCLLSMNMNPHLSDAARNFHKALRALGDASPEWRFLVTGSNPPKPVPPIPRLEATGLLDSPFELLSKSKLVALLSDFGFGFKTKILDALLLGSHVLVTPGLYSRLPEVLKPVCLRVDPADPASFRRALAASGDLPSPALVNGVLRAQAYSALDTVLGKNF